MSLKAMNILACRHPHPTPPPLAGEGAGGGP
jgi:hypothetical protein